MKFLRLMVVVVAYGALLVPILINSLWVNLGNIYFNHKKLSQAEKYFSLPTIATDNVQRMKGIGLVSMSKGDYEGALRAFDFVLHNSESDILSRLARAEIRFRLRDQHGANQDLLLAPPEALNRLGISAIEAQDWARAENFFRLLTIMQPDNWSGYYQLGVTLREQDLYTSARDIWQKGLEISPKNEILLISYGQLVYSLEDFSGGIKVFTQYIELSLSDFKGWYWRGLCYKGLGEYELAQEDFIVAIGLNPLDINPRIHLAQTYEALGERELALKEYEDILLLQPEYQAGILAIKRLKTDQQ